MEVENPETGRKIKVNGPTWNRIMSEGTKKQQNYLLSCAKCRNGKNHLRKSPRRKKSPGKPRKSSPVRRRSPGRPRKSSPIRRRSPGRPRKSPPKKKSPVRGRSPGRPRKSPPKKSPVRRRSPGRPRKSPPKKKSPIRKKSPKRPRKYGKKKVKFADDGYSLGLDLDNVELYCDENGCTEVRKSRRMGARKNMGRELSDDEVISMLQEMLNE
jgi:hypothetical protein